jgi:hypothetical protein
MSYSGNEAREICGVGSIINTHHSGQTNKRPVESAVLNGTGTESGNNPKREESKMNNEAFLNQNQRSPKSSENKG